MARTRIVVANCYDYPQYYDIAFQAYTQREAELHRGRMPPSILPSMSAGSWNQPAAVAD